jgi:Family of unknown function (DUF6111)
MLRSLAAIALPLLLPAAVYLLWLAAARRLRPAGVSRSRSLPWPWLVGAGLVLAALTLYALGTGFGGAGQGTYVPPRWVGGKIIPGHIVPPALRPRTG